MSISGGNTKLGGIPNVSLIPILDCGHSENCSKKCYALKAWKMYASTRKSWRQNSELARSNPVGYFNMIQVYLTKKKPRFFRWHVAGDILNQQYLDGMITIAVANPEVKFLAFTKMAELDYSKRSENLSIVLSRWPGDEVANAQGLRQAWVQDGKETRIPADAIECPGACETCGMCWNAGKDVFFHIH